MCLHRTLCGFYHRANNLISIELQTTKRNNHKSIVKSHNDTKGNETTKWIVIYDGNYNRKSVLFFMKICFGCASQAYSRYCYYFSIQNLIRYYDDDDDGIGSFIMRQQKRKL